MNLTLLDDIRRTYQTAQGGTATKLMAVVRSPGVDAVIALRFGQWLLRQPLLFRVFLEPAFLYLETRIRTLWGIEISRRARIGGGLYLGHSGGIVISAQAVIGGRCNISHGVTIGVSGQGENRGAPVIGHSVYIAPGAKLFGKIHVGNNVKIGANAVIHKDIPENAIVVVDPGFRIISLAGNRPNGTEPDSLVSS